MIRYQLFVLILFTFFLQSNGNVIPSYFPLAQNRIDYSLYKLEVGILFNENEFDYLTEPYKISYNIPERLFKNVYLGYSTSLKSDVKCNISYLNSTDISIHKDNYSLLWKAKGDYGRSKCTKFYSPSNNVDSVEVKDNRSSTYIKSDFYNFSIGGTFNYLKPIKDSVYFLVSIDADYESYDGYYINEFAAEYRYGYYNDTTNEDRHNVNYYNLKNRKDLKGTASIGIWKWFNGKRRKYHMFTNLSFDYHFDKYIPEIIPKLSPELTVVDKYLPKKIKFLGKSEEVNSVSLSFSLGEVNPEFISLSKRYRFKWLKAKFAFKNFSTKLEHVYGKENRYSIILNEQPYNTFWAIEEDITNYNDLYIKSKLGLRAYLFKRLFVDINGEQIILLYSPDEDINMLASGYGALGVEFNIRNKAILETGFKIPHIGINFGEFSLFTKQNNEAEAGIFMKLNYLVGVKR